MQLDQLKKIIYGLSGVHKGLRLYPPAHPAVQQQAQNLAKSFLVLFQEKPRIRLGVLEDTLFFEKHMFVLSEPAMEEIRDLLTERKLEALEFETGLTAQEIQRFFQILHETKSVGTELEKLLTVHGITHIRSVTLEKQVADGRAEPPRKIYQRALTVVSHIFNDVRLGRIPSSTEAIEVVGSMVRSTLSEPQALLALSLLKDYDNYTFTHSVNVSVIALSVGHACGLSEEKMRTLGLGALLHDIGKLIIDKEIITKPGRLTEAEYEEIKKHPVSGSQIAGQMDGISEEVVDIILGHHLNYDRSGYPADARGKKISQLADMATIADTYDAMTTLRSYQRPVTPRMAVKNLMELSGTTLHPQLLQKLIAYLGPYPVGSLVRLDSNELAVVTRVGRQEENSIDLKIITTGNGDKLPQPIPATLNDAEIKRIVAEVDPVGRNIEVTDYFD
ncbi:HD-GYP domain-containing protein [Trichloromonas sp.]|uniref:HD-GYP domain-containing protein n=1 Tax=Trichloromonas sp. TaxID=3069249 RepID=UPI002A46CB3F|nr:HD-GYP domain-containing protein [Trichloromonas sp.]